MRVLLLTHSFNSLCQRLFVELRDRGHEVSVELDINDAVTREAVSLFGPDLVVAPYLKRAIPEDVWAKHLCLVVHPGIIGDRGPSALDWAIMNGETDWGVTILQAGAEMDAGDIWARRTFKMRAAAKSSLYRNEVTEAAVDALFESIEKLASGTFKPAPLSSFDARGRPRTFMRQEARAIDWTSDSTEVVARKIRAADSQPGVLDTLFDEEIFLYNAVPDQGKRGRPGEVVETRDGAICRATIDGSVWITHARRKGGPSEVSLKLPAARVLAPHLCGAREAPAAASRTSAGDTYREIFYEEKGAVGYLHFPFYSGAMSTEQCRRLRDAYLCACSRPTRVIVLAGGPDFWSNGIHLAVIEAAESPAEESWQNITAMNDLARSIISTGSHLTISALQGNAGAGGVFLALAADRVYARRGIVLNPHYKGMGNLYGSEYWTYRLPMRVGEERAQELTELRLPISTATAKRLGLIDDAFGADVSSFRCEVECVAKELAGRSDFSELLRQKADRRARDEAAKPLDTYRAEEMERLMLNFFGFDPSYHVARYNFIHRVPHSRTPPHLAVHRQLSPSPQRGLAATK